MRDDQERVNQLPEIVDVEFLPVLDDEDYKKEKTAEAIQPLQPGKSINLNKDVEEQFKDKSEETAKDKAKDEYKDKFKDNAKDKPENMESWQEKTKEQTQSIHTESVKQDTSYASYDSARKEAFKKKKKKLGNSLLSGIGIAIAILVGFPFVLGIGGTAIFVLGMGIFLSVFAIGMGILGIGMAGFTAAAGMGPMGILFLFGSLVALGIGGLGICIICLIFIGIKNLIVGMNRRRKIRREGQEV